MLKPAFLSCLLAGCVLPATSQTQSISVIASGGGYHENAGYSNSWTIGQLVTKTLVNGNRALTQGFQQPGDEAIILSGKIATETALPVPTVTVSLTGSGAQSALTATDGLYSFHVQQGGDFTVTPSKNNDVNITNGITTLDLVLTQRHVLSILPLGSPYKIIAANVDLASAGVSGLDILRIRQVILGNATTFPIGKLWVFVRSDFVFPNPLNPFPYENSRTYNNISQSLTDQNFIAIKLGDVNNNWNPAIPKTGAAGEVQLMMDEYHALTGNEITVPVKVKDFSGITGYQFTLSWDASVLSLLEVNNKALNGYYGDNRKTEGLLTTSWNDAAGLTATLDNDVVAFEMKFKVTGAAGAQSAIKIGSEITQSEAYNENLDLLSVNPTNGMVKVDNRFHPSQGWNLSVAPNPFSNATHIIFTIPQDETVRMVIYDLLGKAIRRMQADYKAGEHQIEWAGDDDQGNQLSAGLYHIRMVSGESRLSQKVILIR